MLEYMVAKSHVELGKLASVCAVLYHFIFHFGGVLIYLYIKIRGLWLAMAGPHSHYVTGCPQP